MSEKCKVGGASCPLPTESNARDTGEGQAGGSYLLQNQSGGGVAPEAS